VAFKQTGGVAQVAFKQAFSEGLDPELQVIAMGR
jgi:hypothetical protein